MIWKGIIVLIALCTGMTATYLFGAYIITPLDWSVGTKALTTLVFGMVTGAPTGYLLGRWMAGED